MHCVKKESWQLFQATSSLSILYFLFLSEVVYVFLGRASLYVLCSSLCGPWKHRDMPGTMGLRTMSAAPSDSQCNTLRDSTSIPPLAQVVAAHRQEPPASVYRFPRRDNTRTPAAHRRTGPGRGRTGPRCKGPMRMCSRRSE